MFATRCRFIKCILLASKHRACFSFRTVREKNKEKESSYFVGNCDEPWVPRLEFRKKHFLTKTFLRGGETNVVYLSCYEVTLHSRISMDWNGLQLPIIRFCVSPSAGCRDPRCFLRRTQFASLRIAGVRSCADFWSRISKRGQIKKELLSILEYSLILNIIFFMKQKLHVDQHQQITDNKLRLSIEGVNLAKITRKMQNYYRRNIHIRRNNFYRSYIIFANKNRNTILPFFLKTAMKPLSSLNSFIFLSSLLS